MKVLIYEGDTFIGFHTAARFQREGHDVIVVNTAGSDHGVKTSVPHTKYDYKGNVNQLEKIIKNERPHLIVVAHDKHIVNIQGLNNKIDILTNIAALSVKYKVDKLIYLSDISVYGEDEEPITEEGVIQPLDINAKCHVLCEKVILTWRYDAHFSSVILRCGEIYGDRQIIDDSSIVWRLFRQTKDKKFSASKKELSKSYNLLFIGDVVDAIYKSAGEFVEGIYNVTNDEYINGYALANKISLFFDNKEIYEVIGSESETSFCNEKAKRGLGWTPIFDIEAGLRRCYEWYTLNQYERKNQKRLKRVKNSKKNQSESVKYIENILAFIFAAGITYIFAGQPMIFAVDIMALYVIIIGIFFGINHSVLAAVLASFYSIFSTIMAGQGVISVFHNLVSNISIIEYLLIGIITGYVVERKELIILEHSRTISKLKVELSDLKHLYNEVSDMKNEFEYRISEYDDSYGKIYNVIKALDSLAPEEVYLNALNVIKEVISEDNMALYIVDNRSMFIRRIAFIGEEMMLIPKSLRLKDYPKWESIINNKELYANSFLDAEMPSMIVPIVYEDKVVSIIVIHNMKFEKLNLYYINLVRTISNLLNNAFSKAQMYELATSSKKYIENTPILKAEEFEKEIILKEKMKSVGNYTFSILRILEAETLDQKIEKAFLISKVIRSNDDIGIDSNNQLCVILTAASDKDFGFVIDRFKSVGIKAEIKMLFHCS